MLPTVTSTHPNSFARVLVRKFNFFYRYLGLNHPMCTCHEEEFQEQKALKNPKYRDSTRANEFGCVEVTVGSISGSFRVVEQVFRIETAHFGPPWSSKSTRNKAEISAAGDFEG